MAFQSTKGAHLYVPGEPWELNVTTGSFTPGNSGNTTMVSANASAKHAMFGRLWFDAKSGSKTIAKIHWRFGSTITAGSGAVVRVSVQGVAGGSAATPDGNIAGSGGATYTFNMTDSGVTASGWFTTPSGTSFGTQPTFNFGDLLSLVWDWSTAGTGAVLTLSYENVITGTVAGHFNATQSTPDGTTWTNLGLPNVVIEFSDGTFGTLDGGFVLSANGSTAYGATSSPVSFGAQFTLPYTAKCDALWGNWAMNSGATAVAELVNASTGAVITSVTLGNNFNTQNSAKPWVVPLPSEQTLAAGTAYYVGLRATNGTTTGCTAIYTDIASASHATVLPGGGDFVAASRTSSSAVPVTTSTRRYWGGVRLSALDDGSGGSTARLFAPTGYIGGLS